MHSVLVNNSNSNSGDRGVVFKPHPASKGSRTSVLGQSMMLNNAYRVIALLSLMGAFIFGALIDSGVRYVENMAVAGFLEKQPLSALTNMVVTPTRETRI